MTGVETEGSDTVRMPLVVLLASCYAVAKTGSLFRWWGETRHTAVAFAAFLIWLLPLLFCITRRWRVAGKASLIWSGIGIALVLIGDLGHLRISLQAGFAATLAAMVPCPGWARLPWLLAAVAWIPAFGLLANYLPAYSVNGARLLLACLGAAAPSIWVLRHDRGNRP